jgi:hypothetical protein
MIPMGCRYHMTLMTLSVTLLHTPLLKGRRPRRPGLNNSCSIQYPSAQHCSVKYVSFPVIPSRYQRWETTAIHLMGRHFTSLRRAFGSPPGFSASPVEAGHDMEGAAQTCAVLRRGATGMGLGCYISTLSRRSSVLQTPTATSGGFIYDIPVPRARLF